MRRYHGITIFVSLLAIMAAGCITGDDGGGDSKNDKDSSDTTALTGGTFSETMSALYANYTSRHDSLLAETKEELAGIYAEYRVGKSEINRHYIASLTAILSGGTAGKAAAVQSDADLMLESVTEASKNYQSETSASQQEAVDAANDALQDLGTAEEELNRDIQEEAESALNSSDDDGSGVYDAINDMLENEGDGGSGTSTADVLEEFFGDDDSGSASAESALEDIEHQLEDGGQGDGSLGDALDNLGDYLGQDPPEGESDVRSMEDVINDYLEGETTASEALDFLKGKLLTAGDFAELPVGVHEITLDISYIEEMNITSNGLDTHVNDITEGMVTYTVDIPEGADEFEYSAEGVMEYNGAGADNVTQTTWVSTGTAAARVSGKMYLNERGEPMIHIETTFIYSFTTTTNYPVIGSITVPGEKSEFTDMFDMKLRNGAVYEDIQDYPMNKLTRKIELTIAD